jgi:hypothetical protein
MGKCFCPKCRNIASIPESEYINKKPKALISAYCFECEIKFKVYVMDFFK